MISLENASNTLGIDVNDTAELMGHSPHQFKRLPHQVSLFLKDGRRLSIERLHANGAIAVPLTDRQKLEKIEDYLRWMGLEEKTIEYTALKDMPERDSIKTITDVILEGHPSL